MARAGSVSTRRVSDLLRAPSGLAESIAAISLVDAVTVAPIGPEQIIEANAPGDSLEKQIGLRYPVISVYCEKITNNQKEKFRTFSGTAKVVVELRVTSDQLWDLNDQVHFYLEAITRVLDGHRGDWGFGMFYAGEYEIAYSPAKAGGRNYVQSAKVTLPITMNC